MVALRLLVLSGSVCLLWPTLASAASRTLKAGEVLGISADIVLSGDDDFIVDGTAERPCRLDANGQQLRSTPDWTGRLVVRHGELRGLGSASLPALELSAAGSGDQFVIENSLFHACGAVHIANHGTSGTVFRRNNVRATTAVPVTNLPSSSPPIFRATGQSAARKLFQGNSVGQSVVLFENTRDWLIGGDQDDDANVLTGLRASLSIHRSTDMRVRGNYVHTDIASYRWSQCIP
jgi:hypothetical protein